MTTTSKVRLVMGELSAEEKKRALLTSLRTGGLAHLGRKRLSSEVIETLQNANRALTEENQVMRARLDRLEGKEFVEDLHQKALKELYQAVRLLVRVAPKTKRAKKVLHEVRGIFADARIQLPSELRRPRRVKQQPA
jgi:hypothetical protein